MEKMTKSCYVLPQLCLCRLFVHFIKVALCGMSQAQSGVTYRGAEDNFDLRVQSQGIGTRISF